MSYIATSFFDRESWDKYGIRWLETAKAENLNGFVVGLDIPEASRYLKQMGFSLVAITDRTVVYEAIASNLDKNQSCLFVNPELLPKGGLLENFNIRCNMKDSLDIFDITSSVQNLFNRAKVINMMQDVKTNYKGLLSSECILGKWNFWIEYSGFQKYLFDINFLNQFSSPELMFNLYIALMKPDALETIL